MSLYTLDNNKLKSVTEESFELEKDIQGLTEENLDELFGLNFVKTELSMNDLRIDTLAFDDETKAFVIIEYKRDRSFSVIDQGFAYLSLMLNNKAEFVLEYNESLNKSIKREDIDWTQSRVLFIANSFTKYQRKAIDFQDLPIELWEVKKYKNSTYLYNQLKAPDASESINTITKSDTIKKVSREVRKHTLEEHFKDDWVDSRNLYDELSERLMEVDSKLEESPQKFYIGYKIGNKILVAIKIHKSRLILEFLRVQPKDLIDPEKRLTYKADSMKFYNKHVSQMYIESSRDIDYALPLVKQLREKFFSS